MWSMGGVLVFFFRHDYIRNDWVDAASKEGKVMAQCHVKDPRVKEIVGKLCEECARGQVLVMRLNFLVDTLSF